MENLAQALTASINGGNLPIDIETKAKSLLKDIADIQSQFVKEPTKWDDIKVRSIRIDMAFNFATGKWYNTRKRLDLFDNKYNYEVYCYASKHCGDCKFHDVAVRSESMFYGHKERHYCCNPSMKCLRGFGKTDRAESLLVKWLISHEQILIDATKNYQEQLLYIAQNPTQRYKGICSELYKSIQNELITELITYKTFRTLCNQLTQNHS